MRRPRALAMVLAVLGSLFVPAVPAVAAVPYQDIVGNGPIDHVYLGNELSCQVATTIDGERLEFYPSSTIPGDCGTFLVVGGTLYSPDFGNHDGSATSSLTNPVPFTPVSQSGVLGSGTASNPFTVVTVVDAGTDIRLTQIDRYALGDDEVTTDVQVKNLSGSDVSAILYRAGDCYLNQSDNGFGSVNTSTGAVGCQEDAGGTPGTRLEEFVPITAGSSYFEGGYFQVWERISARVPFPNTCDCATSRDNGAGLSWSVTVPPGGDTMVSSALRWAGDIVNQPPVAIATMLPTDWTGPYTMFFTGVGSFDLDGTVVGYEWEFGDGGTSTEASPTHQYLGPGAFDVSLTVTDDGGAIGFTSEELTITGIPSVDFAPEVRLHPQEDHFPMNPYTFIENSHLTWAHDDGCNDDFTEEDVDPALLGSGGYEHREAGALLRPQPCQHHGRRYESSDMTRPEDGHEDRARISDQEGFYLDFDESTEPESFSPVPVWTERRETNTITYWLFYGRSVPRRFGDGLQAQHEGDWEHVNVVLDPVTQVPTELRFFAHHGDGDPHAYVDLTRSGGIHPVVYSAWTAHGSYPDTGSTEVCDFEVLCIHDEREDGGAVWETWRDVRAADEQGWYGFGGAWGHKGQAGRLNTTGPLGPSEWKNPL